MLVMGVKERLFRILEESGGKELSGQELANSLEVSRTAVWKAVNALKSEGCEIDAVRNRGYRLIRSCDLITPDTVSEWLPPEYKDNIIKVYKSVTSTNTVAKKMAAEGAKNGTVIISEEQTAGRGRRGNSFYSPAKTGLYMSVILRTGELSADTDIYTVCAGCAVCGAIERLTDKKPLIKWVNDIFLDGRKICGILSEATVDIEIGCIDSIVVGIGLNLSTDDFPDDIRAKAGSLGESLPRSRVAAAVIEQLFCCLNRIREENIEDYKRHSLVLGMEVGFVRNGAECVGRAVDIDSLGRLLVETAEGVVTLNSGEISLKSWQNTEERQNENQDC